MKRHLLTVGMLLLMLLCATSAIYAKDEASARTISVSGQAEVSVVPDMVMLKLGVEQEDADLNAVKARTDMAVSKVLALADKFGIAKEDVKTDYINIRPQKNSNEKTYYYVQRSITFLLKNLSDFDKFLNAAMEAGANCVYSIQFMSSENEKYQNQALKLAIKDAKATAKLMANELGMEVGKPITVNGGNNAPIQYDYAQYKTMAASASGNTLSVGKINIVANVNITFELVAKKGE